MLRIETVITSTVYQYGSWAGVMISEDDGTTWTQLPALPNTPGPVVFSSDYAINENVYAGVQDLLHQQCIHVYTSTANRHRTSSIPANVKIITIHR